MKKITRKKVASWIPIRNQHTYKNKLGHILCIGGDSNMGGAIILSAMASVYSGAGLVTVATTPENRSALHSSLPEVMFTDIYNQKTLKKEIQASDVILVGPGLGRDSESEKTFHFVLEQIQKDQWLLIDADGLYFYAQLAANNPLKTTNIVVTPHLGEWERLSGIQAPANDQEENQKFVRNSKAIVVLKKSITEVYIGENIWENTSGNPSMATGGMGDTLAGIIAGFLGQFKHKEQAVLSAVYIHSAIADQLARTHYVTLPTQISKQLPLFIKSLLYDSEKTSKIFDESQ